jgi:TPR repeat protein
MHRLATEYNDPSAQYLVGRNYLRGKSVEKNVQEAIKWFEMAAKQNHIRAQYQLGTLYLYGKEIKTNLNFAFYFLSKAAEKNHLDSQYELANYYLKGNANKRQYAKAAEWYSKAAQRGHVRSQFELGKLLYEGRGIQEDNVEALKLLNEAAESGLLEATNYLNNLGDTPQRENISTFVASNDSHSDIESDLNFTIGNTSDASLDHYQLGIAYLTGDGKEKNVFEASQHFEIAANAGHGKAQYQLAKLYEQGIGVKQSNKHYLRWLEKAAKAGVISATRDLNELKLKETPDIGKPEETILDLPKARNDKHSTEVKNSAAVKNFKKSDDPLESKLIQTRSAPINTFLQNAKNGDRVAQYEVGIKLLSGEDGFERDVKKAIDWLQTSANNHYTKAKTALGMLYYEGTQVERDYKTATMWLEKSANDGDPNAQFTLGSIYQRGLGVDKNNTTAIMWYRKAANQGHRDARKQLGGCRIC